MAILPSSSRSGPELSSSTSLSLTSTTATSSATDLVTGANTFTGPGPIQSATPNMLNPGAIGGITVAAVFAAVVCFFVFGSLIACIRRRMLRKQKYPTHSQNRWLPDPERGRNSYSPDLFEPPYSKRAAGANPPLTRTAKTTPSAFDQAGKPVELEKIGMAVSPDGATQPSPQSFQSVTSISHLIPIRHFHKPSTSMEKPLPAFPISENRESTFTIIEDDRQSRIIDFATTKPVSSEPARPQRASSLRPKQGSISALRGNRPPSLRLQIPGAPPISAAKLPGPREMSRPSSDERPTRNAIYDGPRARPLPSNGPKERLPMNQARAGPRNNVTSTTQKSKPVANKMPNTSDTALPSLNLIPPEETHPSLFQRPSPLGLSEPLGQSSESSRAPSPSGFPAPPQSGTISRGSKSYVPSYYTSQTPAPLAHSPPPDSPAATFPVKRPQAPPVEKTPLDVSAPNASRASVSSGGTTFESIHSDEPTPPEELDQFLDHKQLASPASPTSPMEAPSPISGLRYPKVPRSSNQVVPRSPLSPRHAHSRSQSLQAVLQEQQEPKNARSAPSSSQQRPVLSAEERGPKQSKAEPILASKTNPISSSIPLPAKPAPDPSSQQWPQRRSSQANRQREHRRSPPSSRFPVVATRTLNTPNLSTARPR